MLTLAGGVTALPSRIDQYKKDIERLSKAGAELSLAMHQKVFPGEESLFQVKKESDKLPYFLFEYQKWYSEALALVVQLMPDRSVDFKNYYAPSNIRKSINNENYTISDYLRGISITDRSGSEIVGLSAAIVPMLQQLSIVQGLADRFESTLFDIRTLLHADLLDDELEAAEELNKKGFQRGAGAMAGVVLESHLASVCERHSVKVRKSAPAVSDLNDALKAAGVLDVAQWRFIQHLGDLRNKCDHKKLTDPTRAEVSELVEGVRKITKTVL